MNGILEIIASLTESFIVIRFCNRFLGFKSTRFDRLKSVLIFSLLAADNILLSQLSGFENISVILLLIFTFLYSLFFLGGKIYEKILAAIVPAITALPINLIVIHTFSALSDCSISELTNPSSNLRIMILFFSKLAFFLICEILIKMRRRGGYSLSKVQWIIQLSCFGLSFLISNSLWSISRAYTESQPQFLLIYIMIAALNVLLYILLNKMQRDNIIKEEYNLVQTSLKSQERLVIEARERYAEIRTLRHDVKHCLTTLAELIADNKINEAEDYIESVINEKINTAASAVDTGSVVIDAVINNKIVFCAKNKIAMKCLIDTRLGEINDVDISILLSNMLDNAINGCNGSRSPSVELVIGSRKSYTGIIVKNSIAVSVLTENPELKTNKKDKTVHGFGIDSIRKIAQKYDGNVDFHENGSNFIAEVWLKNIK
ncbi:MAG: GHKL domain-containing protein [Oscillospiraceae bacterium]|nr:GHKL domain-containing protein [Oscillospiraceae bacterium]